MELLQEEDMTQGVVCFQCGKTFSSQSALSKHLKVRHLLLTPVTKMDDIIILGK